MTLNNSGVDQVEQPMRYADNSSPRLPNAQVNQDKLKIILQQLKKIDRNSIHTSRWYFLLGCYYSSFKLFCMYSNQINLLI